MPRKIRTNKRRAAVKDFEAAWLEGDREAGFMYSLHHTFVHQELWERAGDHENFFGSRGCNTLNPSSWSGSTTFGKLCFERPL
jgi:hypothetical protein